MHTKHSTQNKHIPVLLNEVENILENFQEKLNGELKVLDCTLGEGGHSIAIFRKIKRGVLVSIDIDNNAIESVLYQLQNDPKLINNATINIKKTSSIEVLDNEKTWIIKKHDFSAIKDLDKKFDIILCDLGFSHLHLRNNLGISFSDSYQKLDMRYNRNAKVTASEIINTYEKSKLNEILAKYGEIKNPDYISNKIIKARSTKKIITVGDLKRVIKERPKSNYITARVFYALRVEVNSEFSKLDKMLSDIPNVLNDKGISLIITFNTMEEQIVNRFLKIEQCIEPKINEIIENSQSRSAKLQVFYKKKALRTKREQ